MLHLTRHPPLQCRTHPVIRMSLRGRTCLSLWGRCRLRRRRGPYVPSNLVNKETTDSGHNPTHIDTNISYHISSTNSTHIFAFFEQIPNITRSDKKHLHFANHSAIIAPMQGSYIGNTTASQAVKAGSTPVPCSKTKGTPLGCLLSWTDKGVEQFKCRYWVAAAKGKDTEQTNNSGAAGVVDREENQLAFLLRRKYNTVRQT